MNIKRIFLNEKTAPVLLPIFLKLDNILYKLISRTSVLANNNKHPKHNIIKYEQWFIDKLDVNEIVLEVGSHSGEMSKQLATKADKVIAVEIEQNLYARAIIENSHEKILYICGDATKIDMSSFEISTLALSNVLEHIKERDLFLKKLINSIKWKNTPRFLIRVPMATRDWVTILKKQMNINYFLDPTHYTEYSEKELKEEIERSGLKIKSWDIKFGESFIECTTNEG